MVWSLEDLQSLPEDCLHTEILIPLFEAMGFQQVRRYHGGPLEQGKDVVMWKETETGRRNYAIVAKTGKITGSVEQVKTIVFQAAQALGSQFIDEATNEEYSVDEAYIVSSGEVTPNGSLSLKSSLDGLGIRKSVTTIGGQKLWSLVKKHLPQQKVIGPLVEGYEALGQDPSASYAVQLTPGEGPIFTHLARTDDEVPLVSVLPFPDSEAGRADQERFEHFLATGEPVELEMSSVEVAGLPKFAQILLSENKDGKVVVGPSRTKSIIGGLILRRDGRETVLHPYLELSGHSGSDEAHLDNSQQPISHKFSMVLSRTGNGRLTFRWDDPVKGAASYLRSQEIMAQLNQGGELIFEEYENQFRFTICFLSPGGVPFPLETEAFLETVRRVVFIQRQTRTVVALPERGFFTSLDLSRVQAVETVIKTGKSSGGEFTLDVDRAVAIKFAEDHPDGKLGELRVKANSFSELVLDTEIPLGQFAVTCENVSFDPEVLRQSLDEAEAEAEKVRITLFGSEEAPLLLECPDWPKQKPPTQPE